MDIRKAVRWAGVATLAALVGAAVGAQQIRGFSFTVIGVDGNPVVGAKASLTDLSSETNNVFEGVTDAHGEFMKTGISYSDKGYKFVVEVNGAQVVRYVHKGDQDLKSDDTGERKILLSTLNQLKLDLRKAVAFKGVVKDETGSPVVGGRVKAVNLDDETKTGETSTNGKGEYEISNLPFSGKGYTLTVERSGLKPIVQRMSVSQLGTLAADLDLSKPQEVRQVQKTSVAKEAQDLYKLGDFEGALAKADEALKDTAEDPNNRKAALLIKGQCLDKLSRAAEAQAVFEEYLPSDPKNVEVVGVLSRLAEQAGDKTKAQEYQKQYLALGGKVTGHHFNQGVEAFNAGDNAGAVKFLELAVSEDPADSEAHKALAMAYARTGNYGGVAEHLKTYLKLKPDAADRAQWEAAIPTFEQMAKPKK